MNSKLSTIVFIFLIGVGCSKEDEVKKAEIIPGYWQVLQKTSVLINGIRDGETTRGYYIEFYENNCGQLFDRDENPTDEFKWAYQENEIYDRLLISTEITSSDGSGTGLFMTRLHAIDEIVEMNFQTFRENETIIDGDEYSYNHWTYFVKQR